MKSAFVVVFLMISTHALADASLRVDGERLNETMEHMHTFGENAEGGSDRVAYSDHNRIAYDYLFSLMLQSGLMPRIDVAGNLVGRMEGNIDGLAPIVTGSEK